MRDNDGDDNMPEPHAGHTGPFHTQLPEGLEQAVRLAREVLKQRGMSDDEIDEELAKLPEPPRRFPA